MVKQSRRGSGVVPFAVSFVCTGNICRSPMGDVILATLIDKAGLADKIRVESAGTGGWHEGGDADPRAVVTLARHGYDGSTHRAKQFKPADWQELDLVLALDRGHERFLRRNAPTEEDRAKIHLLRSFDAESVAQGELEVDDPYTGTIADFERAFTEVEQATKQLFEHLRKTAI